VGAAVVAALDAHGSFMAVNNTVSQSVPHVHVHVVPRRRKDGLRGFFWPRTRYDEGEAVGTPNGCAPHWRDSHSRSWKRRPRSASSTRPHRPADAHEPGDLQLPGGE
jgi:diadenosine tetraphosphate (Ap4A) HIT family hydrolase